MAIKGMKSFYNVKIRWILMLNLTKKIMTKYKMFFMKMALDNPTNNQVLLNYEHLCGLQIMFGLSCILSLLKFVHDLIKFAQSKDVFVRDLVVAIKVYQGDVSNINCDQTLKFTNDNGPSNHCWSSKVKTSNCIRYLISILEFHIWPLNWISNRFQQFIRIWKPCCL